MAAGDAEHPALKTQLLADHDDVIRVLGCDLGGHLLSGVPDGLKSIVDVTQNDSDKTFTVPANKAWHVQSLFLATAFTATNGSRQIMIDVRDDSDVIVARYQTAAGLTANTSRNLTFGAGMAGASTGLANEQLVGLPPALWLPAAWDIRVYDIAAIDAAADDLLVGLFVREVAQ